MSAQIVQPAPVVETKCKGKGNDRDFMQQLCRDHSNADRGRADSGGNAWASSLRILGRAMRSAI
ncbi:hypothetical protein Q2T42_26005 [Leptolyngbya boryana CZ1]|uniref:Uncharacterized protein n=1 Tax=Leptolyngbya boryana CZ1 TaxID=3060204 RepID=A0AA96WT66_LEPBY|nr:hypothetical protein [Leptolyngbya boryana]WNZ45246.1 hypothetical protein Q2T42_26005 [Leptolyngbya boryana CZ1]